MANNFFLNQDPLLFQSSFNQPSDDEALQRQINDTIMRYNLMQKQRENFNKEGMTDYIGELDKLNKSLDENGVSILMSNPEYMKLHGELQNIIQDEILANIKWKINTNQNAVKNIEQQMNIIKETHKSIETEQRKNLLELNDYVKNYSDITFDEYKRIKNGEPKKEKNNTKKKKDEEQ